MKKIIVILFIFFNGWSFAQNIGINPLQTTVSSTVEKGSLLIEMGLMAQTLEDNAINAFAGPSTLLRYGIIKGFELRIFNQFESYKIEYSNDQEKLSGLSDLELGIKVQLFKKEGVNTQIAFLSHAIIPTAKDELSNEKIGTINKLSISHGLSESIRLGYNIGYSYVNQIHNLTYSAALCFALGENLGFYLEPYGVYGERGFFQSYFDGGITYLASNNFQLDVSYGAGLNNDLQFFHAGFRWNIPSLFGS